MIRNEPMLYLYYFFKLVISAYGKCTGISGKSCFVHLLEHLLHLVDERAVHKLLYGFKAFQAVIEPELVGLFI